MRWEVEGSLLHDAVVLELGYLRALEGIFCEWISNHVLCGSFLELLNKLVVDALLDIDSRACAAALAMVEEDTKVDP